MNTRLALIVSVAAPLALYLATAAPGVTLVDSGELALACSTLGIAHPPGFPLYVMLGRLFAFLPLGADLARRLNLFSSVCAALAAGATFLLSREMVDQTAALAGALAFGFSLSLWSWAVVTEVYALNIFLLAVILWLAMRGQWRATALAAGLALGVHHATILAALPAALYLLWTRRKPAGREWRIIVGLAALGLLCYLYLPIRAAQRPWFNWGNPNNLERFWWHVSAKQYRVHLFEASLDEFLARGLYFMRLAVKQFTPAGFLLACAGLVALARTQRRMFWFIILLGALNVGFALNYDIAEDIEGYYLPAFLGGALCLAAGAQWVMKVRPASRAAQAFVLAIALAPAVVHFSTNNRRHDRIAALYVENTLRSAGQGALILTSDWQFFSPWLYRRYAGGLRPDVAVVDTLMLRRSWYLDFLERQYPELARAAAEEMEALRRQLDLFEHDQPYDPREIDGAFVALVRKLADSRAPVYLTLKIERPFLEDRPLAPQGLLYKVARQTPEVELDLTGLNDGSVRLDAVEQQVRDIYATMQAAREAYRASVRQ